MSALRNCANFREKTRERAANFVEFRCTAHTELGRHAPRALHNTHKVGRVPCEVITAFGFVVVSIGTVGGTVLGTLVATVGKQPLRDS